MQGTGSCHGDLTDLLPLPSLYMCHLPAATLPHQVCISLTCITYLGICCSSKCTYAYICVLEMHMRMAEVMQTTKKVLKRAQQYMYERTTEFIEVPDITMS